MKKRNYLFKSVIASLIAAPMLTMGVVASVNANNNWITPNTSITHLRQSASSNAPTYDISKCTVTVSTTSYTYDGKAKAPKVDVRDSYFVGTYIATEGTDYRLSYENNINAGTATVIVTGIGKYKGSKTLTFTIQKATDNVISDFNVVDNKPSATAKYGVAKFKYCSDSSFANNVLTEYPTTSGTYYVKAYVEDNQNYNGVESTNSLQLTVSPTDPVTPPIKDVSSLNVVINESNLVYSGSQITPTVTVSDSSSTLTLGTDYEVSYENNVNAGNAKIIIAGKGNYVGSKDVVFQIQKNNSNEITEFKIENNIPFAKAKFGNVQYKYWKENDATNFIKDYPTIEGTWFVQAYVEENNNYSGATSKQNLSFVVKPEDNKTESKNESATSIEQKNKILIICALVGVSIIVLLVASIITTKLIRYKKIDKK